MGSVYKSSITYNHVKYNILVAVKLLLHHHLCHILQYFEELCSL